MYIRTQQQIENNTKMNKKIILEKYNPEWAKFFAEESLRIKNVMRDSLFDIYHVGSTSVPGLSAKPVIDIIITTTDLAKTKEILTNTQLGYSYKGEYNLPLRDLYGKIDKFKINLHVHMVGSAEIELNLLFAAYLREYENARKTYEQVKIKASKAYNATNKVENGIPYYNLLKNDIIMSILRDTGFSGLCVRFVTQENEHRAFDDFECEFLRASVKNNFEIPANIKKMVLYKGVNIIGAAKFSIFENEKVTINFIKSKTNEGLLKLTRNINDWIKLRIIK